MTQRTCDTAAIVAILDFACAFLAGAVTTASREPQVSFEKGQSFYVVALRADAPDSALLTLCPRSTRPAIARAVSGLSLTPSGEPQRTDAEVKLRVEAEFRRQKRYRVFNTLSQADYVFLVQAIYAPTMSTVLPESRGDTNSQSARAGSTPPLTYQRIGGDERERTLQRVMAVVVPATVYASLRDDASALLGASLWQSASSEPRFTASPEDLVRQMHRPGRRSADGSYFICASLQPERAPALAIEPSRNLVSECDPTTSRPSEPEKESGQRQRTAVTVPVVVSTAGGDFVTGLKSQDFRVFEDGVPQHVTVVGAEPDPLTAVLVIDTSLSMLPRLTEARVAAGSLLDLLRPADRALIVTFDNLAWLVSDLGANTDELRRAILRLQPHGVLTRLYDALAAVASGRVDGVAGRKSVVVVTDGLDTDSYRTTGVGVMEHYQAAGIPIYVVQLPTFRPARPYEHQSTTVGVADVDRHADLGMLFEHATDYLKHLALETGGSFAAPSTPDSLTDAFRRAANELRHQYVLCYYPSNSASDGAFRSIRVEVNLPGVAVKARPGYRAAAR